MKGKVLLPLDASEASLKAYMPAKSIAELLGMNLVILHITDEEISQNDLLIKLNISKEDLKCFLIYKRTGKPEQIILEEGENCNYIVMGTHGKTCDESLRMGSTAAEVVEKTSVPVILIKPGAPLNIKEGKWLPHKTLIPLNGTPGSAESLTPAMEILSRTGSEINILHICGEKEKNEKIEGEYSVPYYEDYPQHEWTSWSKEFIKRFCPVMKNHIKTTVSLAHGHPAEEILKFSRNNNNDFIAVVWHGTMEHLRAKTLKKLLFECSCPLMLIKLNTKK